MVDRIDLKCNDLVMVDTKDYDAGPVAVIRLPFSLKREHDRCFPVGFGVKVTGIRLLVVTCCSSEQLEFTEIGLMSTGFQGVTKILTLSPCKQGIW